MKRLWSWVVLSSWMLASTGTGYAAAGEQDPVRAAVPGVAVGHPGVEVARTVSLVTGVALSPLLGVGAVGAYDYFTTPKERRQELHWYANPLFWIPALLLVGAVALKDTLGAATVPGLKKPLDVAEVVENKVSGLVAAGAFLPAAMGVFALFSGEAGKAASLSLGATGFASLDGVAILNLLLTPFALVAFVLVWLASHALNVVILLSPFPAVDAGLKALRFFLLSLVTGTTFVSPWVGAVFALGLIVASYFLAGWAFRLTVCGGVFAWDLFTRRRRRFLPTTNANWMFLARAVGQVPVRTYGRLVRTKQGRLEFEYRPWLLFQQRTLVIPEGEYFVGRGLFFSEIHRRIPGTDDSNDLFDLPPRYRTHEDDLGRVYLMPVEDVGLRKGLKAVWQWLRGLFSGRAATEAAVT